MLCKPRKMCRNIWIFSFFKKFDLKHHACGSSEIIVCIWYENLNIVFIKLSRLYSSKICVSSSDSSQNMAATLFFFDCMVENKTCQDFFLINYGLVMENLL